MIADNFDSIVQQNLIARNTSFIWNNEVFWLKNPTIAPSPFFKKLHSYLLFPEALAFLRPSQPLSPTHLIEREIRKNRAFALAGFPVPEIARQDKKFFITKDISPTLDSLLKVSPLADPARHDRLLIACAEALGKVHQAGLCHGRPHPRDMFVRNEQIGFFDFEEEPEAVMPLAMAQARDVWLLFLQICYRAKTHQTCDRAFEAYSMNAPHNTLQELENIIRFSAKPLLFLQRFKSFLGKDLKRFIVVTTFLERIFPKAAQ